MIEEKIIIVRKVWGEEIWLVNGRDYCGKLLLLDRNAESSYHRHKVKRETFAVLGGRVALVVEGEEYVLAPFTNPITIEPGEKHKFIGITSATLIEFSTHHDEADVERFSESKAGNNNL